MLAAVRAEKMPFLSLVTLTFDLDLQTRPSEGPNTFSGVNLAQIRSPVLEIFHTQTKTQTDGSKNRTFRSSLRAVNCYVSNKNRKKRLNSLRFTVY